MTTSVYEISSPKLNVVYIGYTQSESIEDIKADFLKQATLLEASRGDARWLDANDNQTDNIVVTVLEQFDDEFDAWMYRNECRAYNDKSITGPSVLPAPMVRKAANEHGDRVARYTERMKQRACDTARQAYAAGRWTKQQIQKLASVVDKKLVVSDLDKLNPSAFAIKYADWL